MSIEEIKRTIEHKTGVPAYLLKGETLEENIAQAKAILAYKGASDPEEPKAPAEQFAEWFKQQLEERTI